MTASQVRAALLHELDLERREGEAARFTDARAKRAAGRNAYMAAHPEYATMTNQLPLFEVPNLDEIDEEWMEGDYDVRRNGCKAEKDEYAQIVGSALAKHQPDEEQHHRLLLDLDHPALLLDSSTPGHHHLYVDVEIPDPEWRELIKALAKAGVIEEGYAEASLERGHTDLRLPWVRKP